MFNVSKGEEGTPAKNLKKLVKLFKEGHKCSMNKDEFRAQKLKNAKLLISAGPTLPFTPEECKVLTDYVREGGHLFLLSAEGGDRQSRSNLSTLLKGTGIAVQSTVVVRSAYYKYYHPKEVLITNGVLQRDFVAFAQASERPAKAEFYSEDRRGDSDNEEIGSMGLNIVYPFGTTLSVRPPAVALLASGTIAYPVNEAILAYEPLGKGAVFVLGSWKMLSDDYLDSEENAAVASFVLNYAAARPPRFRPEGEGRVADAFAARKHCPDVESMSESLKCAIQDVADNSANFLSFFDGAFFKTHFDLVPETLALYKQLAVKHEAIRLINPIFETPLLGLSPGTFPPILVEPEEPGLELYDLDDEFANPDIKLAQLTNNATNDDLEVYITESARVLGLKEQVNCNDPREVLIHVLATLIKCKISS